MRGETLFKNPEVFDPEYVPEVFLHRDSQLRQLAFNLKPALMGSSPISCVCLGPPATGKTTAVKYVFRQLEQLEECGNCATAYVNCLFTVSKHQMFARLFERIFGFEPPTNAPFSKLYEVLFKRLVSEGKPLAVALDDANTLETRQLNEIVRLFLKAHEVVEGVKVGVFLITTDPELLARHEFAFVGEVVSEVLFPPYSREELRSILVVRAEAGFFDGVLSGEALEAVTDAAYEVKDLRYGIALLRLAGIEAEKRASRKIEVEDVESAREKSKKALVEKVVKVLSREEKILLRLIYRQSGVGAGNLYREFRKHVRVGYTKFNEVLRRLETLRIVDVVSVCERGVSRRVVGRYDPMIVLSALSSS